MVQGAGLLKKGWGWGGGGEGWHFSYLIFSRIIVFTFRNYFTLCNLKISHKLR